MTLSPRLRNFLLYPAVVIFGCAIIGWGFIALLAWGVIALWGEL